MKTRRCQQHWADQHYFRLNRHFAQKQDRKHLCLGSLLTPPYHIYPSFDQETSLKFSRTKVKQLKTAIERCETYSFTVLNNYGLFYPSWVRYKFQSQREVSKVNETDETLLTMGAESSLRIFLPFFFFFPFKIPFSLIYNEITIYHVTVSYG